MNKGMSAFIFASGLAAVGWVGWGFVGSSGLALAMTALIAGVYVLGAAELGQYRAATSSLRAALGQVPQPLGDLGLWLERLHPSLQGPVRQRIEGARGALPAPTLTPYLVGLLVMLGMLGTFLGMVVTFKGAVFALEGSSDLAAIRAALAEPIKGLGLSFGTSVAGVAASAMLGLLSALGRRERLEVVRQLDARIATDFKPFTAAQRREDTFQALQVQAQAMPQLLDRLQAMVQGLERRTEQLDRQLLGQQQQFHAEVATAYTRLASDVGQSLADSLQASARLTGETIKPVIADAMTEITQALQRTQQHQAEAVQTQLQGLSAQWAETAGQVSATWGSALQTHAQTSSALVSGLDQALHDFTHRFEQRSGALLAAVHDATAQSHAAQTVADRQRQEDWQHAIGSMAGTLATEWRQAGAQTLAQQQAACQALEAATARITEHAGQHVGQVREGVARLLEQSEALVQSRRATEAQWIEAHGERMDRWTGVWQTGLTALREQEAERGQAAVERLDALQAAVAQHLAQLGASLEEPMARLLQTASSVPQAAAEVIAQLRQEMAHLSARDNLALSERTALLEQLGALLQSIGEAAARQRAAIESLVESAGAVLEHAGSRFADALGQQAGQADAVAAQVAASAVELSSLGESFGHGVELFSATSSKLIDSLQRIDGALGQSQARSDEQLAYYVAQAREVIDLSISAQQGIVEDLRRLHGKAAAQAQGAA